MAKYKNNEKPDVLAVAKALSDMSRLRALYVLQGRELCVCQIVELLELAPSTVSKHMSILRDARLVESYKEGRWVHYRLPGDAAPQTVQQALDWALGSLRGSPAMEEDEAKMQEILKRDPEEICRKQAER